MKIGLVGCAGVGKSSISREVSNSLQLPFLSSKDITRPFLEHYGYVYGNNNCVEKFLGEKTIEFQIVEKRCREEDLLSSGFITDRTNIESFCYALLNYQSYDDGDLDVLESICKDSVVKYDCLFYLPYDGAWFEENNLRTTNSSFQRKIDMIIRGIMNDWKLKPIVVPKEIVIKKKVADFIVENTNKSLRFLE